MDKSKIQILNTFVLKIMMIVTMTLDHIGIFLIQYAKPSYSIDNPLFFTVPMSATGYVFRCIGRLALPLIAILFVEAMRHTHSRENYFKRLGIMAGIVLIAEIIMRYTINMQMDGNIFFTLLCAGTFIYFVEKKDNKVFFCLIPIFFVIMGAVSVFYTSFTGGTLLWWPNWLRPQYDLYGFLMMVGLYFMYYIADYRVLKITKEKNQDRKVEELREYPYYRTFVNILWAIIIIAINFLFWILARINVKLDVYFMNIQSWAFLAALIPFFYNGKKGYSSKKWQFSFYAYYPLHLVILFVIFGAIFGFGASI